MAALDAYDVFLSAGDPDDNDEAEDAWFQQLAGHADALAAELRDIAALLREGGWDGTDVVAGVKGLIQWAEHLRETSVQDRRELG